MSNKDDTHTAVLIVGELTEENLKLQKELLNIKYLISSYEKQTRNSYIAGTICTATPSIIGGGYMIIDGIISNNQALTITGIVITITPSLVYQGSHLIFKFW